MDTISLLCQHVAGLIIRGDRAICRQCRSFRDLKSTREPFQYNETYPQERKHFEAAIGSLKVESLKRWLRQNEVELSGVTVCEVGFGAGYTLNYLHQTARGAWGIEVVESNLQHARSLGVPGNRVLLHQAIPARLSESIDLWLFLDSFEHLPDPTAFMKWAQANTSSKGRLLIVMPRADSLSQRMLGSWWPHRVPDHPFHWSRRGIVEFLAGYGFQLQSTFWPWKNVSIPMLSAHMEHKWGFTLLPQHAAIASKLHFPFNIGEMGLLFKNHEITTH